MDGQKIRVFSVEDHEDTAAFYRLALELEPDIHFLGNATSTEGLIETLEHEPPSVLMLDLMIPGCDSLETLTEVRARFPSLAILVVSGLEDEKTIADAFRRGATGFFLKTMDMLSLASTVRRAAAGERVNTGPTGRTMFGGSPVPGLEPRA